MSIREEMVSPARMETAPEDTSEDFKDETKEDVKNVAATKEKAIALGKTTESAAIEEKATEKGDANTEKENEKTKCTIEEITPENSRMDVDDSLNGNEDNKESVASTEDGSKSEEKCAEENKKTAIDPQDTKITNTDTTEENYEEEDETSAEDGHLIIDESMLIEEETEKTDEANMEEDDKSKCSRELKLLLKLSKESNLNTNINHKRKSVEPRKLFNKDNLLEDDKEEDDVSLGKKAESPLASGGKRKSILEKGGSAKKLKKEPKLDLRLIKKGKDPFCWQCHKNVVPDKENPIGGKVCNTCPRSYHYKCLKHPVEEHWQCPECVKIVKAENLKTRSPSLKSMDLKHLCSLLKFALKRMIQVADCEPFMHPVKEKDCPDYKKYIVYPMDLTMIQNNIENNVYGSTDAFESDTKWILHNSIIYNSYLSDVDQSKLTSTAKYIEKICKQEMSEIENCSNCYLNANTKMTWFVEVCPKPHILIWAKLKGFPYWPAKAMMTNKYGLVDVRFFGAHDRAWVSHKDCYLYSQKNPNQHQMKKYNINECIMEVEVYIENLRKHFGVFKYAPFKTPYNPDEEYIKLFLPKYVAPGVTDNRKVSQRNSVFRLNRDSPDKTVEPAPRNLLQEYDKAVENEVQKKNEVIEEVPAKTDEVEGNKIENDEKAEETTDAIKNEEETKEGIEKQESIVEKPPEKEEVEEPKEETPKESLIEKKEEDKEEEIDKKVVEEAVGKEEIELTGKEKQAEKETTDPSAPVESKKDYEENDLLEVLYSEDVGGESTGSNQLKDDMNKVLPISKKLKTYSKDDPGKGDDDNNILKKINSKEIENLLKDKGQLDLTVKSKPVVEKSNTTNNSVLKSAKKAKPLNENNKTTISLIRPDLLLKTKKGETAKINKNKRKSVKEGGEDWLETFMESDKLKKKKAVDLNSKNRKVEDEVIIIKCEPVKDDKKSKNESIKDDKKVKNEPQKDSKKSKNDSLKDDKNSKNDSLKDDKKLKNDSLKDDKKSKKSIPAQVGKDVPFENAEQRELFQALNISEKGTEVEKPKVHEIRTRSKTEEMYPNTFKQRARKSFPKTKLQTAPSKEILPANNNVNKTVTLSTTTANKIVTSTSSQNVVLVPAPLIFQGATNNQLIAMVAGSNNSYTILPQGSNILNGNINLSYPHDKVKTGQNPASSENNLNQIKQIPTPPLKMFNQPTNSPVQISSPEVHSISNEVSLTRKNKTTVEEKGSQQPNLPMSSVATSVKQFNPILDPLNSAEFTVLNGIIGQATPNAIKDVFNRPPPMLKPRPPGPLRTDFEEGVHSSAGPWTARINSISHKLSDYLRGMLIETLNDVSTTTEDPEALVATLQLELETCKAKHAEEVLEIKKNVNSLLQDIQKSIIEEREKITSEVRAQCALEMARRVEEAKSKQWCANCMKEAQFYCCWNTSYCDYPCQTKHWSKHMSKCTQNSQSQGTPQIMKGTQILLRPVLPPKGFSGGKPILAKQPTKIILGKAASSVRTQSSITVIESRQGNFEVIANGQIADGARVMSTPPKGKHKSILNSTAGNPTKTIILQSTNAPVMTPTISTPEKKTDDSIAV